MLKKPVICSPKHQSTFRPQVVRRQFVNHSLLAAPCGITVRAQPFAFLVNPSNVISLQAKKHEKPPLPIIKHEGTIFVGHEIKQPEDLISHNRAEKKKQLQKQKENLIPLSKLTDEQKNQIKQLRNADPIKYSSSVLQKMFNISPQTVAKIAPCPDWRKQQLLEELSLTPIERRKRASSEKRKNLREWIKKQQAREATLKLSRKSKARVRGLNFAQLLDNMVIVDKLHKKKMKAAQKIADASKNSNDQQKS
mmetsp:Transcript_12224/g.16897  ORF Transcript_12224/g.16897 Transcript_12224/m.16897 type:complete len:251 (+) Transcript_12224:31-783(+)